MKALNSPHGALTELWIQVRSPGTKRYKQTNGPELYTATWERHMQKCGLCKQGPASSISQAHLSLRPCMTRGKAGLRMEQLVNQVSHLVRGRAHVRIKKIHKALQASPELFHFSQLKLCPP